MNNYDPNDATDMNTVHIVKIKLQTWEYTKEITERISGNVIGLPAYIDAVISKLWEELPEDNGVPYIVLTRDDGGTLTISDDEDMGDDFLKELIVSAEIIDVVFEKENEA